MILACRQLHKAYGIDVILEKITFHIEEREKAAIVGVNGAGKTTLFKVLTSEISADGGEFYLKKDASLGYLAQNIQIDSDRTIYEEMLSVFEKIIQTETNLRELENEMGNLSGQALAEKMEDYATLQHYFEQNDGYSYQSRLRGVLKGLGFADNDFNRPMNQLSGGQKTRVHLAKLLLSKPDILLLDEPTNHLDLEMIEWLEGYLNRGNKTIFMVTHDRFFLDKVCNTILELDDRTIYTYRGNYAYYLEKRQERMDNLRAEIQHSKNLYRRELDWMRRQPQARGHKAKYREDAFYELEKVAKQRIEDRQVRLKASTVYIGSKIFECQYVSKAFDDRGQKKVILDNFYYNFARFEKMGIVGNNGTGKSTFIKMLLGEVQPDSGKFDIGETVRFGYFSQEGLKFREDQKVIDVITEIADYIDLGGGKHMTASQFLQFFLFTPEEQHNYVYKLSGGEKRKLYLCTVLMRNPNFLVLDEPTNDLDIQTLQVLEEYLQDFAGCVIVVSHDRYFMDKVVDHLLVFKGEGEIQDFPGNYTQYREWSRMQAKDEAEQAKPAKSGNATAENDGAGTAKRDANFENKRKMSYKEKREYEQLTQEIDALTEEQKKLEEELCSGNLSVEELTEKSKRLPEIKDELDEKEMRWLELAEML